MLAFGTGLNQFRFEASEYSSYCSLWDHQTLLRKKIKGVRILVLAPLMATWLERWFIIQ